MRGWEVLWRGFPIPRGPLYGWWGWRCGTAREWGTEQVVFRWWMLGPVEVRRYAR